LILAVVATIVAPVFFLLFLKVDELEKVGVPIRFVVEVLLVRGAGSLRVW